MKGAGFSFGGGELKVLPLQCHPTFAIDGPSEGLHGMQVVVNGSGRA